MKARALPERMASFIPASLSGERGKEVAVSGLGQQRIPCMKLGLVSGLSSLVSQSTELECTVSLLTMSMDAQHLTKGLNRFPSVS